MVAPKIMYWSITQLARHVCQQWGLRSTLSEVTDRINRRCDEAWSYQNPWTGDTGQPNPASPTSALQQIAHRAGALLCVTLDSGDALVLSRPSNWAPDIVMHSATKYLNGHSDVMAGALVEVR